MIPQHPAVLSGEDVYRIHWVLGADRLLAVCHCGAQREFEDPVALWDWLLDHPEDHHPGPGPRSAPAPQPRLRSVPETAHGPERESP
ncbi:hypothetical protein [Streptomyces sp. NPDC048248]|uniref:hypothetical protein n=1 Tax=Streptomyces sp. NPDC048248 TaxID=3365523 RepID=UPI00371197F0